MMTPPGSEERDKASNLSAAQGPRRLRVVGPAGAETAPRSSERPLGNLPLQLSSFFGCKREISEVNGLLAGDARLLTLTGSGGCGKTRLALAVASEIAPDFEDGAWWVGLASLSDPDLVPQAVASALKVREVPGRTL